MLSSFKRRSILQIGLLTLAAGCGRRESTSFAGSEKPVGAPIEIKAPLGLPPVPIPAGKPETRETIALGRKLFYDKKLSSNDSVACASCHNPLFGFTDGQKLSSGVEGRAGTRNAPTLINAAYVELQFWDGRAPNLEEQVLGPLTNPVEMNQSHELWISKLAADATYRADFQTAFGPGPITIGKVKSALASFE